AAAGTARGAALALTPAGRPRARALAPVPACYHANTVRGAGAGGLAQAREVGDLPQARGEVRVDPRRLEPAPGALEQQVPPLRQGLSGPPCQHAVVGRDRRRRGLAADERLPEGLREGAAEAERLADRAHLGAEPGLG